VLRALRGEPLPIYGDGSNVRDWLHVEDHARAIDLVLERGDDLETYNVGGRAERSNLEMAHAVLDILGQPRSLVRFVADRPGHDLRYALDDTKIERDLGFSRSYTLERGLVEVVRFLADHRELLESRRDAEAGSLPGE
jgi:dTDP-glucose 4,6-dehydratase